MLDRYTIQEAEGMRRKTVPDVANGETIREVLDLTKEEMLRMIDRVVIRRRLEENCVSINIIYKFGSGEHIYYIKLPIETPDHAVDKFIQPLLDKVRSMKNAMRYKL